MIAIDTQEKLDWLMNALEDREIVLDNRKRTKEDDDEVCREIAQYKAMRQKIPTTETVLA
jgi:polysaccharide pyruvyl transferase WcaK-like protein